ncbi:hypothetical protein [Natronomonas gomsonensis]|uniref:hypothetical protein n=1 Tax=Natronomonas gomsonensis TaxID=1046043 RepID=UPI0015B9C3E9|nr:hypothetical protein [Natronomonas gomsonensis]
MSALPFQRNSWLGATVDVLLASAVLGVLWYPALSVGNELLGSPLTPSSVTLLAGTLAVGSAYPFVAGPWSLGRLGEFCFVFVVAVFALGIVGTAVVVVAGLELSGSDPFPSALLLGAAYLVAFVADIWGPQLFE